MLITLTAERKFKYILALTSFLCLINTKLIYAANPNLSFDPESKKIATGETFEAKIVLDTDGIAAAGTGAVLIYDPKIINIVSLTPGTIFADYPNAIFDNNSGRATLSGIVSSPNNLYSGKGTFGTVVLQGVAKGTTELKFDFTSGKTTDSNIAVTYGIGDALTEVKNLNITVTADVVTPEITAPPTSLSTQQTQSQPPEVKTGIIDKIKSFFGIGTKPDPAAPITSQQPNTNPDQAQRLAELTPKQSTNSPSTRILGIIILIVALVAFFIYRRLKSRNLPTPSTPNNQQPPTIVSPPQNP